MGSPTQTSTMHARVILALLVLAACAAADLDCYACSVGQSRSETKLSSVDMQKPCVTGKKIPDNMAAECSEGQECLLKKLYNPKKELVYVQRACATKSDHVGTSGSCHASKLKHGSFCKWCSKDECNSAGRAGAGLLAVLLGLLALKMF